MKVESTRVFLKSGHVQPVWAGHPWVFAQAIARVDGKPEPGAEVVVCDPKGEPLGRGLYSPSSAIAVRLFTRDAERELDAAFFEARIRRALERRRAEPLPSAETSGYRAVHAEGDGLPGLIVDVFGDAVAVQWGTVGLAQRANLILDVLERTLGPRAIVERTSREMAQREGFAAGSGVLRGDASMASFRFRERGLAYEIPLALAQKTGFYFDQRPLRARVEALSAGRRVLDSYCFVGSIALAAARGGAREVVGVDSSGPALEVAARLARDNGLAERVRYVEADALAELEKAGDAFDLVVCDPPKLAPNRSAANKAMNRMRRLCAAASRALSDGGWLVLSSCSAALGHTDLARALALGARDVGREAVVLERLFQGADHPVPAAFPEGLYLSSIIAVVQR
ncbi:MAG TPA: class I SAM-dependent rRNA methyltransferase [Polyangiaceae bacterium]|nr:class I SAM-dependent rRNA methyltransferase [Polyangiaceae bacterium]